MLEREHEVFVDFWKERPGVDRYLGREDAIRVARAYDRAYYAVSDALQPFALTGWHCTRLTEEEILVIVTEGMRLPDEAMLRCRIHRLVSAGALSEEIAENTEST